MKKYVTEKLLADYEEFLRTEEKSAATIDKYLRDIRAFQSFAGDTLVNKEMVVSYKKKLIEDDYADNSINSVIASLRSFFRFAGWQECSVRGIRVQKQIYSTETKELTKDEYERLVKAAKDKPRLHLLIQTICSTGVRVSEISYFTVEAVKEGEIRVSCKNKNRIVLLPGKLRKMLLRYAKQNKITGGIIFKTRNGKPLNRSNIWAEMKALCDKAQVDATKVFPHNLRKLFARIFHKLDNDIAKLADILGHTSVNTTRIYIMSTGREHRRRIERMGLVLS